MIVRPSSTQVTAPRDLGDRASLPDTRVKGLLGTPAPRPLPHHAWLLDSLATFPHPSPGGFSFEMGSQGELSKCHAHARPKPAAGGARSGYPRCSISRSLGAPSSRG